MISRTKSSFIFSVKTGERRMELTRKAVSGIMLTLLILCMLALAFTIQPTEADQEPQLSLDTDKDIYILGENVTITLTNMGSETVNIGGYPAWTIFTYPKEEPVYPNLFAFLAWSLDAGENDTFTWNQYNETGCLVEPGMYVIRDTQRWGLSAYFEIVATEEQWVPYVPSFQMVDLKFWMLDRISYINVSITFSDDGFSISDWGTVVREGCEIWADSKIWDWTGPSILVITRLSHTYNLGRLESGNYTFTFKAWGDNVKSINFTVAAVALEFPPAIILPLFMILSSIVVIFVKRRLPRKPKN